MPPPARSGRPPADPSGRAKVYALRLPPAVHGETLAAADRAGLSWSAWAARELEAAAARDLGQDRFATLESVLVYASSVQAGQVREELIDRLAPALLANWPLLRAAIAGAWAEGRGKMIAEALEEHAKGTS